MSLEKRRRVRPASSDAKDAIDVAVLEDEKEGFARAAASLVRDILEEFDSFRRRWRRESLGQQSPPTPYPWMVRSGVHQVTVASWLK